MVWGGKVHLEEDGGWGYNERGGRRMATEFFIPLGKVTIEIDGAPISFKKTKLKPMKYLCPDVADRFMLEVDFEPDGKEHLISCCLCPSQPIKGYYESGEHLECYSYYSADEKVKATIGIEADSCDYDYDSLFKEENGIFYNTYAILPSTKTSHYVFGVCWIMDCDEERDAQTWFGADPTIMGK